MPQVIALQTQQIQRGEKVSVPVAAGSAMKADAQIEKVILSYSQPATEHYAAKKSLRSMLHHKYSTTAKPTATRSSQSHPENETYDSVF